MNLSIDFLNLLPEELQLSILTQLDGESLLAAWDTCWGWKQRVDAAIPAYFKQNCCSENYVGNLDKSLSISQSCRLNIRIVLAAKKAWKTPLKPVQYGKLRRLLPRDRSQANSLCPVNIVLKGANTPIFYSADGCRLHKSPLVLKKYSPLRVEVAQGGLSFEDCSVAELEAAKEAYPLEQGPCLFTPSDPLGNLPKQDPWVVGCKQEGLVAIAFASGKIAVFEEKGETLNQIYSTDCFESKAPLYSVLFNRVLELFITTRDGGIFSIRPFPDEKKKELEEKPKPEPLCFEAFRHIFKFN